MASSISSSMRIRFVPQLAKPPGDRPRRNDVIFPTVAQCKGSSGRELSYDLFWSLETLSAASGLDTEMQTPRLESNHIFAVRKVLNSCQSLVDHLASTSSKLGTTAALHSFGLDACPPVCSGGSSSASADPSINTPSTCSSASSVSNL